MADSSCSNSDDHYVSLGRSNDSTEDTVKKVLAGTQRAESEEDSMSTTVGGDSVHQSKSSSAATDLEEFPIPKPLSSFEVKDFQEALMGELEGHYYSSESLLGLPSPLVLARRLKRLNFRKTFEFKYRNRSFWPFLPLLVKAEINPLLTVAEGILTWIVILSWVQAVVYGGSVVGFVGGVALFFDLTILHYWYGFTRYNSFHSDWYNSMLTGKAIDENFEQTRDICSAHVHGDSTRRNQSTAVLWTTPVSIFNHGISFVIYGIHRVIMKLRIDGSDPPVSLSLMWGAYVSNVAVVLIWLYGGPFWMTVAALNLLVNQQLYNSLLFRRDARGFLSSLVFGTMIVFEPVNLRVWNDTVSLGTQAESEESLSRGTYAFEQGSNSILASEQSTKASDDVEAPAERSTCTDSLFGEIESVARRAGRKSPPRVLQVDKERARRISDEITEITDDFDASQTTPPQPDLATKLSTSHQSGVNTKLRNPTGVYLDLEQHRGTLEWRAAISEATRLSEDGNYNHRIHAWVMKKLKGKCFYDSSEKETSEKLNPLQIRRVCKSAFKKQKEVNAEVEDILEGLKDLKEKEDIRKQNVESSTEESSSSNSISSKRSLEISVPDDEPAPCTHEQKRVKRRFGVLSKLRRNSAVRAQEPASGEESGHSKEDSTRSGSSFSKSTKGKRVSYKTSDNARHREIYLGLAGNPAYQHFLKVLNLAAEDHELDEYNDEVHEWIIPRVYAKAFYVKTQFGTYREANALEVRKFAEERYSEARKTHSQIQQQLSADEYSIISGSHFSVVEESRAMLRLKQSSSTTERRDVEVEQRGEDTHDTRNGGNAFTSSLCEQQPVETEHREEHVQRQLPDRKNASKKKNEDSVEVPPATEEPLSNSLGPDGHDFWDPCTDDLCGGTGNASDDEDDDISDSPPQYRIDHRGRIKRLRRKKKATAEKITEERLDEAGDDDGESSKATNQSMETHETTFESPQNTIHIRQFSPEDYYSSHSSQSGKEEMPVSPPIEKSQASNTVEMEEVKQWVGEQTLKRRFKSKVFARLWKRAKELGKKARSRRNQRTTVDDSEFLEGENSWKSDALLPNDSEEEEKKRASPLLDILEQNSSDSSDAKHDRQTLSLSSSSLSSSNTGESIDNDMSERTDDQSSTMRDGSLNNTTLFDKLMIVLEADYCNSQREKARIISAESSEHDESRECENSVILEEHSSTMTSSAEGHRSVPPATLLQYLEQKILDEEYNCGGLLCQPHSGRSLSKRTAVTECSTRSLSSHYQERKSLVDTTSMTVSDMDDAEHMADMSGSRASFLTFDMFSGQQRSQEEFILPPV